MSLINDALRRKKEEKDKATPQGSDGTPMQPVHSSASDSAFPLKAILAVVIVLMLLVASMLFWKAMKSKKQLAANSPAVIELRTDAPHKVIRDSLPDISVTAPTTNPVPAPMVTTPTNLPVTNSVAPTNPLVAQTPPGPVPLKLQGIFYRPTKPTVMINGKTLGVGEKVAGARVLKIERESVTVERDGKQETLELE